jgi:hypothetical protein
MTSCACTVRATDVVVALVLGVDDEVCVGGEVWVIVEVSGTGEAVSVKAEVA